MAEASLIERTTQDAIFLVLDRLAPRQTRHLLIERLPMNSPDTTELKCARETTLAGHLTGECLRNSQQLGCGGQGQCDGC